MELMFSFGLCQGCQRAQRGAAAGSMGWTVRVPLVTALPVQRWMPLVDPTGGAIGGSHWWLPFLDAISPTPRDPTDAHPHDWKLSKVCLHPPTSPVQWGAVFADTALLSSAVLLSSVQCSTTADLFLSARSRAALRGCCKEKPGAVDDRAVEVSPVLVCPASLDNPPRWASCLYLNPSPGILLRTCLLNCSVPTRCSSSPSPHSHWASPSPCCIPHLSALLWDFAWQILVPCSPSPKLLQWYRQKAKNTRTGEPPRCLGTSHLPAPRRAADP